ncbi:hypothetical protein ACLOJK_021548 [Asimina triloba]
MEPNKNDDLREAHFGTRPISSYQILDRLMKELTHCKNDDLEEAHFGTLHAANNKQESGLARPGQASGTQSDSGDNSTDADASSTESMNDGLLSSGR